jgi:hypothetical protein
MFLLNCSNEENTKPYKDTALLGEVAQISLSCINVENSLAFYQKLNYSILEVKLEDQTPWALISDGSQLIMLSQNEFPSPTLTFYGKSLGDRIKKLQKAGMDLETISDEQGKLKSAVIRNPIEIGITLINFDTDLLPKQIRNQNFTLGIFSNLKIPVSNLDTSITLWERAGFKTTVPQDIDSLQQVLKQGELMINLFEGSLQGRAALCYTHHNETKLMEKLKEAGIEVEKAKRDESSILFLKSPDEQLFIVEVAGLPTKD